MRIYLAAWESSMALLDEVDHVDYILCSFAAVKGKEHIVDRLLDKCDSLLVDSGAHTFQKGIKGDIEKYVDEYCNFIKKYNDNPKIEGFFEMDIENVVGLDKVMTWKKKLEQVSDKIIPVWHRDRGIPEYERMCKEHSGKKIGVTGFKDNDLLDEQMNLFINLAHKYGTKVHVLGATRFAWLSTLHLGVDDSIDSSSWLKRPVHGEMLVPFSLTRNHTFYFMKGETPSSLRIPMVKLCLWTFLVMQKNYKYWDNSVKIK